MAEEALFSQVEGEDPFAFGRALLIRTTLCFKLATMHELSNAALDQPVKSYVELVNGALQKGEAAALQFVGENVFLNRDAVKLDAATFESAAMLRAIFRRIGVGEINVTDQLTEDDVRGGLLRVFQQYYRSPKPTAIVKERLPKFVLRKIGKVSADGLAGEIDERQNVVRCYALVAVILEQVLAAVKAGRAPRMSRLRRAVQGLADASKGHDALLVGLTRSPNLRGQVHFHLAAVGALVLLMGRRIGLDRVKLVELCLAALFHDMARGELPPDLAGASGALEVQRVPLKSILALASEGVTSETLCRIAVAFECTLRPDERAPLAPGGMARLVAVPCAFDLLTSPIVAGGADRPAPRGLLPDQALRLILDRAGERYDERVVRLFASVVGLYPVGTCVEVTGGLTGIVLEVPSDPAKYARPRLKIVRDQDGPADYVLDLAESPTLAIERSVAPEELDLNAPAMLLA